MKRLTVLLVGTIMLFGLAGSAMALPALPDGYSWVSAPFWTPTDLTTGPSTGNSQFEIRFENASYESDFGLFSVVGDLNSPTLATQFQVFSYQTEVGAEATVAFQDAGGVFSISLNGGTTWTPFDKVFGFYFAVHTGGSNDSTADYFYYTWSLFNTPQVEQGQPHILTAYNSSSHIVRIYLDDQLTSTPPDYDYDDMVVSGNDLKPVPEPNTMLLLGSALLGLAFYRRQLR